MDRLTSRSMLAGAAIAAALTTASITGAVLQFWWLVVGPGMALLSATFLLTIDTARRVRYLPMKTKQIVRKNTPPRKAVKQPSPSPRTVEDEVSAAIKVLQSQYIGRLDRLQSSVEQALRELQEHSITAGSAAEPKDGAT